MVTFCGHNNHGGSGSPFFTSWRIYSAQLPFNLPFPSSVWKERHHGKMRHVRNIHIHLYITCLIPYSFISLFNGYMSKYIIKQCQSCIEMFLDNLEQPLRAATLFSGPSAMQSGLIWGLFNFIWNYNNIDRCYSLVTSFILKYWSVKTLFGGMLMICSPANHLT